MIARIPDLFHKKSLDADRRLPVSSRNPVAQGILIPGTRASMEKKRKGGAQEQDSLIPVIKGEEKRLEEMLADARERAAKIVAEAERRAAELLKETEAGIPAALARERESRIGALQKKAAEVRRAAEAETRALERAAEERLPAAVSYLLSRVLLGGRP
jgi:vacuolar-type H+-ATPase subunit H